MDVEKDAFTCYLLKVQRLRRVLKWLGLSCFIIWVAFSSYYHSYGPSNTGEQRPYFGSSSSFASRRHLLNVENAQENCNNDSFEECECSNIHNFQQESYCVFVQNSSSCGGDDGFIPYFELVYCSMPYTLLPLSMIILAFWLMYLFLFLGTTAAEFFCKALTVITRLLHLSQNVAGVTLLAIGNGAPDIFSVMAAFNHPDEKRTSLAFGALFGAGMFVITTVVGSVVLLRPFNLTRRPFMRDNIFYLFAVYWALYILWDNKLNIGVALGFLAVYASYVILVIAGTFIYQKWFKRKQKTLELDKTGTVTSGKVRYTNGGGESGSQSEGSVFMDTDIDDLDSGSDEKRLSVTIRHTEPPLPSPSHHNISSPPTPRRPSVIPGPMSQVSVVKGGEGGEGEGEKIELTASSNGNGVIVASIENDDKESETDIDEQRPMTPAERSASRASHSVYGTDKEDNEDEDYDKEYLLTMKPVTPHSRPSSHLEKVLGGVMNVTEDLVMGGNPNLAKVWGQAYKREIETEKRSRSPSPAENQHIEDTPQKQEEIKREQTPLLRRHYVPPKPSFKKRQVMALCKLLKALFPFGKEFLSLSILRKIFFIIKFPVSFILTLTIPVIDNDLPLNNWNRWLSILHCVTAPVFASITTEVGLMTLGNSEVPAVLIVFVIGLLLAILVAVTSHDNKPPIYHCVFAWVGFALSIIWIYTIANEIVNLLQVFGVVIKLSDGILGITLLAWGNSIQDAVTNLTMARQGFPRMAVGACFGGPLLNLLIGVGLASIVKIISERRLEFKLYFTQVEMLAAFFLLFTLSTSLVLMSCLKFRMHRWYSVILFTIYIIFLIVVILAEILVFDIQMPQLSPL